MRPEHPECRYCGGCSERYSGYTGLKIPADQWLEEMGEMISASVQGMRKMQSYAAHCHERVATSKNLYT
jgi:hypothetical protein